MLKVSIYGIGDFGFALLKHLSEKADKGQFSVCAYDKNKKLRDFLRKEKKHPIHYKNIKINKSIIIEKTPKNLIKGADVLILAITSNAISCVIKKIKPYINKKIIILNTAKAIDPHSGERPSAIICNHLKDLKHPFSVAMLAGGTIAKDLFNKEPLGADIACKDKKVLKTLKNILISKNLNLYETTDLAGVEYAAALKNAISILSGIMRGLKFSHGSETYIISRAANEAKELVINKLGGKEKTFSIGSQCWGNDMWMSATGNTRNRKFGILLGQGYTTKEALATMQKRNKTVEGVNTIKAVKKIIKNNKNAVPILYNLNKIISNSGKNAKKIILDLVSSNKI
ncbi:hypothetical protein B6D52_01920 [Candidatus Parcubacteria bacterium 4484_255]|nr:MAG: hypothetical protein B6D52_01920 [Candidatus Parcubacteria bacterium 4484_255]